MEPLIFLAILTFQITVIAIVAIVFRQTELADKAIAGLSRLSSKLATRTRERPPDERS